MNRSSKRINGPFKAVNEAFREFCDHTPIHGVQYTGQGGRKPVERVLWIGILIIAASFCSYLIYKSHKKWMETPVLVNFKTEVVNIWEIPFPAVTICPGILRLDADIYKDDCAINNTQLLMSLICGFRGNGDVEFPELQPDCNFDALYKEALNSFISDQQRIFFHLQLDSRDIPPDILLTEFGLCYTFNLLDPDQIFKEEVVIDSLVLEKSNISRKTNWKLSKGYEDLNMSYPFRVFAADFTHVLYGIAVDKKASIDKSCRSSNVEGFTIMLHSPIEYPTPDKEVIIGSKNSSIMIYVKPRAIYASEDIESIPVAKRRCYFEHESNLRFFQYYTETNCQLECLSNYTYELCNCVPVHLPRSADMSLCKTSQDMECSRHVPAKQIEIQFNSRNKPESCNCLPNCNELVYESETIHSSYIHDFEEYEANSISSIIYIYFWESEFWPATRLRFHNLMDFLADCGSLMGLCMGVSFVSLIEILYHCSFRHFIIRKKLHDVDNNQGQAQEVELKLL